MHVQFLNSPAFAIDENGQLSRSAVWLLSCDNTEDDVVKSAEQWAGSINAPWRVPATDGQSYTLDESSVITRINCKPLDSRSCEVTFYGVDPAAADTLQIIPDSFKFERRKDLTEHKSAQFKFNGNAETMLPAIGDTLDWAGSNYRCEAVSVKTRTNGSSIASIEAVNTAITSAGAVTSIESSDFRQIKSADWLLLPEALEDFLNANQLHAAAAWAGENYYISSIKTQSADSANRTLVTLQARYSDMKMIEVLRHEEVVAMENFYDVPKTLQVWTSIWRARAEDKAIFESMLGSSAGEWTGNYNTIVNKVEPKRISDQEYEYTLEARYPEDIGKSPNFRDWRDDDLPDRVEYYIRTGSLRMSAVQCGYSYRSNGNYVMLNRWQPQLQCPLDTTAPLPVNWINQPVKILEVVEVSYQRGSSTENLFAYTDFFSNRTFLGYVGNIYGSFLCHDLDIDDVTDSRNREFTRITKIYRLAPVNRQWNQFYWI